jgi:hypothetical protein
MMFQEDKEVCGFFKFNFVHMVKGYIFLLFLLQHDEDVSSLMKVP